MDKDYEEFKKLGLRGQVKLLVGDFLSWPEVEQWKAFFMLFFVIGLAVFAMWRASVNPLPYIIFSSLLILGILVRYYQFKKEVG